MSKNQHKIHLLPIILAVLLVAALAAVGWLFTQNSALRSQVTTLQDEIAALNGNANAAEAELNRTAAQLGDVQADLTACQAELAACQSDLAEAQEALTLAAGVQAESDEQIIALNAALDAANAQLEQISADKDAADAALAALGYGRITVPAVVEPMPEGEETFGETPVEEYVTPTITVYTAEALGLTFEGPLEWIIATDSDMSDTIFTLREETQSHDVYTQLTLTAMPMTDAPADEQLAAYVNEHYGVDPALCVPVTLLGAEGLQLDLSVEPEQGVTVISRAHMVVLDGKLYAVEISAAPDWFDAALKSVFLPVCESLRLIP